MGLQAFVLSLRPWSFPVTVSAVAIGAAVAYRDPSASVSAWSIALSLVGALGAHAFGNIINTYGDYVRGLDRADNRADDRAIVDGSVTTRQVKAIAATCLAVSLAALVILATNLAHLQSSSSSKSLSPLPSFLLLASAGLFLAYAYTGWPLYLKYRRLGDVAIFLSFGPLLVQGAHFVQTGWLALEPLWFSITPGLLTEAILHANNARDIEIDRAAGAKTLANTIGFDASYRLFQLIYAVSYATLPVYAVCFRSLWFLLPLLTLPALPRLMGAFRAHDPARIAKKTDGDDGGGGASSPDRDHVCDLCGQFSFAFGALLAVAIVVG